MFIKIKQIKIFDRSGGHFENGGLYLTQIADWAADS